MINFKGQARRVLDKWIDTPINGVVTIANGRLVGIAGTKRVVRSFDGRDTFLIDDIDAAGNAEEFNAIDASTD